MSFSPEWNQIYQQGRQHTKWPWSDVISLCHRFGCLQGSVLELGCGTGANVSFFHSIGMCYKGMDASLDALGATPHDKRLFVAGDFTTYIPGKDYDLIIDRAAVTHNSTVDIHNTLDLIYDALKPGGYYLAIDWFGTQHSEFARGNVVDINTRNGYTKGQFKGVGNVHFSSYTHLQKLFNRFSIELMEQKVVTRFVPDEDYRVATWNVVARKVFP